MRCDKGGFRVFGPGNFPDDVNMPLPEGGEVLISVVNRNLDADGCRQKCVDDNRCKAYAFNAVQAKCRTFNFAERCGITTKKKNGKDVDFNFW